MIFNQLIGIQNVRADLVSPFRLHFCPQPAELFNLIFFHQLKKFRLKQAQNPFSILNLRTLGLRSNSDAGRNMGSSDRRFHFIDILPAWAGRAVKFPFKVALGNIYF